MRLRKFRILSFDCYGTLIDWESGIFAALGPLLSRLAAPPARNAALEAFARVEFALETAAPGMRYPALLAEVHRRLAAEWGVAPDERAAVGFGASVGDWPAFADSAAALTVLKQGFQLIILSNVDRESFAASARRLGARFDAVFTAEDIGSYKPDAANFRYLIDRLAERGIAKAEILHAAQSLFHDHAPAQRAGLATAWIDRRHGENGFGATMPPPPDARYDFRFPSLAAMAAAWQAEATPPGAE